MGHSLAIADNGHSTLDYAVPFLVSPIAGLVGAVTGDPFRRRDVQTMVMNAAATGGGAGLGTAQGGLNTANGVVDVGIGMLNLPAVAFNNSLGLLQGAPRAEYIESPDWSEGVLTHEHPTLHGLSRFAGGTGVTILAGLGSPLPAVTLPGRLPPALMTAITTNGGRIGMLVSSGRSSVVVASSGTVTTVVVGGGVFNNAASMLEGAGNEGTGESCSSGSGGGPAQPANPAGAGDEVRHFLGDDFVIKRHDARSFVAMSRDGMRRFRMDYEGHGYPPHGHLEVWDDVVGDFVDAIPGRHHLPFSK